MSAVPPNVSPFGDPSLPTKRLRLTRGTRRSLLPLRGSACGSKVFFTRVLLQGLHRPLLAVSAFSCYSSLSTPVRTAYHKPRRLSIVLIISFGRRQFELPPPGVGFYAVSSSSRRRLPQSSITMNDPPLAVMVSSTSAPSPLTPR